MKSNIFLIFIIFIANSVFAENFEKLALEHMQKKSWSQALLYAKDTQDTALEKLIISQKLLDPNSGASFKEIEHFLRNNPDWPFQEQLRAAAEKVIESQGQRAWFEKHFPVTNIGQRHYLYLSANSGKSDLVKKLWIKAELNKEEQISFYKTHRNILNEEDMARRIDQLLWEKKIDLASSMLSYVSNSYQIMFKTRIAALQKSKNLEELFKSLPTNLKVNSGLLYDYLSYHVKANPDRNYVHLFNKVNQSHYHSKEWWKLRAYYARELLIKKKYKAAIEVAKNFESENRGDLAESKWMAGWITLRYLHKPNEALKYFTDLYDNVSYPVSLARGAYWIGRCHKAMNKKESANDWFKKASKFTETFYGQLAHVELGKTHISLPSAPLIKEHHHVTFNQNQVIRAGTILLRNNFTNMGVLYLKHAIANIDDPAIVRLIIHDIAEKYKNNNLIVNMAKTASYKHVPLINYQFPTPYKFINHEHKVEKPLIYSIIRQESVFDHKAISYANAYGLMQLIDDTAKRAAKSAKVPYNKSLLTDAEYNIKLGSNFLYYLVDYYKGSYILTAAAYNAGEGNPNKWIKANGDPREMKDLYKIIDWIENIPFSQTREYVQLVIANLEIYRVIINKSNKLDIVKDLMR